MLRIKIGDPASPYYWISSGSWGCKEAVLHDWRQGYAKDGDLQRVFRLYPQDLPGFLDAASSPEERAALIALALDL